MQARLGRVSGRSDPWPIRVRWLLQGAALIALHRPNQFAKALGSLLVRHAWENYGVGDLGTNRDAVRMAINFPARRQPKRYAVISELLSTIHIGFLGRSRTWFRVHRLRSQEAGPAEAFDVLDGLMALPREIQHEESARTCQGFTNR